MQLTKTCNILAECLHVRKKREKNIIPQGGVILRLSTGGSMKAQVSVFVVRNFNKGARWMP